ncbi:MAG: hypothetical protein HY898_17610 [Deltaproteobacteria bacterium]|nr:hypothetical protein [Deltaproteobacteria bacterium]
MPRFPLILCALSLAACSARTQDPIAPQPLIVQHQAPASESPTDVSAAPPHPAPVPRIGDSPQSEPRATEQLRATTAMPMEGKLDAPALVSAINQQVGSVASCAALIRRTDAVVGSLNLRVDVDSTGSVRVALESPVNDEAKRCLQDGFALWRVRDAGQGRAMVLLSIVAR